MTVLPHRRYRAGRTTTPMSGCPTGPDDVDHAEWLHRLRGEQCTEGVGRSWSGAASTTTKAFVQGRPQAVPRESARPDLPKRPWRGTLLARLRAGIWALRGLGG